MTDNNDTGEGGHRSGFVALTGQPNVGKSTLLNKLLGEKLAIVSRRPQTTRTRILGIHNGPGVQIAFLDTPGIHEPTTPLNRAMVALARGAIEEVDASLLVTDVKMAVRSTRYGGATVHEGDREVIAALKKAGRPAALLLNKIDTVSRDRVLPVIDAYSEAHEWAFIYPLSARTGEGVERLPELIAPLLPVSPPLFPPDVLTDQAERILASEYIREQVFRFTHAEVPYGVAVEVRQFDETERGEGEGGLVRINADIIVEKESQKGIVIGRRGAMLRRVGTAARTNLERLLGTKVWLGLHVRVEKDWTRGPSGLRRFE